MLKQEIVREATRLTRAGQLVESPSCSAPWAATILVVKILKALGIDTGWEIMIFVMALVFIMGFFFDWLEICLIVLPIFGPILTKLSFEPHLATNKDFMLWFTILVAVNLQSAFLTPPFGFALFYMKGTVPPSVNMGHIYR